MNTYLVLLSWAVVMNVVRSGQMAVSKENFLSPRQIFFDYDNIKSFVGTIYRYLHCGINYLTDKFNVIVANMVGSKSGRIHYRDYQVLRIDAVNQVFVKYKFRSLWFTAEKLLNAYINR